MPVASKFLKFNSFSRKIRRNFTISKALTLERSVMKTKIPLRLIILFFVCCLMSCCTPELILLHGDLSGVITDAETEEAISGAIVTITEIKDTTVSESDGTYLFRNLSPGNYELKASKLSYATSNKNVTVASAKTQQINFTLSSIPIPSVSDTLLDFTVESTKLKFAISRIGKGRFTYAINPSQDWIIVSPSEGNITDETDTITVTIDRTGLSGNIYKETIRVAPFTSSGDIPYIIIHVYLNGCMDVRNKRYYKAVKIGNQIWMAENLNIGDLIPSAPSYYVYQSDNGIIEKHCMNVDQNNCDIYGGWYQWDEAMQYKPSDDDTIGATQGICPAGWHLPTKSEWSELVNFLGGKNVAGGKLKQTGIYESSTGLWLSPNLGATNESGFTALPGGCIAGDQEYCGSRGLYWSSTESNSDYSFYFNISYDKISVVIDELSSKWTALSVRCVKDP
jgi:uncharacterized protein (TIGR02145 family)